MFAMKINRQMNKAFIWLNADPEGIKIEDPFESVRTFCKPIEMGP